MKKNRTVLEAKRYGTYNCRQDTPLLEVSQEMVSEDISAIVIVDREGYLVGILSRTDLLRAYLTHEDWDQRPASEFMSTEVVTVSTGSTLLEVARLLVSNHIHRVVVVDETEAHPRPVAVVSDSDLVYHMVKDA